MLRYLFQHEGQDATSGPSCMLGLWMFLEATYTHLPSELKKKLPVLSGSQNERRL